jgi:hypothetical protein
MTTAELVRREEEQDQEGLELSHEEVWDDSALVDAWNAAQEEYEVRRSSKSSDPVPSHGAQSRL